MAFKGQESLLKSGVSVWRLGGFEHAQNGMERKRRGIKRSFIQDKYMNKALTLLTVILNKKPSGSRGRARRALTKRVLYKRYHLSGLTQRIGQ